MHLTIFFITNHSFAFTLVADMTTPAEWNPAAMLGSPMFETIAPWLARLPQLSFPGLPELNALLDESPVTVENGATLRFVPQGQGRLPFELQYEPRCYLGGELQTREHNWHDLFNALVWLAFPQAKAVINARHYRLQLADTPRQGASQRGSGRDMLTLLDESGVIVASADPELSGLLCDFQWKELFWRQRDRLQAGMGFYIFGHGLYEKAMDPYVGMTGQGLILPVEPAFFQWSLAERLAYLDGLVSRHLTQGGGQDTRELTPVPLLGMPGWSAQSAQESFYDDSSYFRPQRSSPAARRGAAGG